MQRTKQDQRNRIHKRIRKSVQGTSVRPRLCVYRSNKEIYGQLIDDLSGVTIAQASSRVIKVSGPKIDQAKEIGKALGEKAKSKNIDAVVFDRNGYLYHGRVKAFADGAREAGLQF